VTAFHLVLTLDSFLAAFPLNRTTRTYLHYQNMWRLISTLHISIVTSRAGAVGSRVLSHIHVTRRTCCMGQVLQVTRYLGSSDASEDARTHIGLSKALDLGCGLPQSSSLLTLVLVGC
jgi:hypothetical protein